MKKNALQIGLALSGGGMRAAVYHLGLLKCLAKHHLLAKVSHISTVSGASLCMGMIYSCNHNQWPNDEQFLYHVLPHIENEIICKDIQWTSLIRLLVEPYYWNKKPNLLANVMENKWHIYGDMQCIPAYPKWSINTTAYETGKDFRISNEYMGNKHRCFVVNPQFTISHAIAASAGFPVLIGPYKLKTKGYNWIEAEGLTSICRQDKVLHLWDGGVYDNMGLDPLFALHCDDSFTKDINYLIVSNASGNIEHKRRRFSFSVENLKRLLDINMDQVQTLKSTNVINHFKKNHNGIYVKIGTNITDIVNHSCIDAINKKKLIAASMKEEEVQSVADYKTSLSRMDRDSFQKIMRHSYELANCSLYCYGNIQGLKAPW